MTQAQQITQAVNEIRRTGWLHWSENPAMYRLDDGALKRLARLARRTATVEARMLILEDIIASHDEQLARFWKTRARGLRAKNSEINALRAALGHSRPVLRDCIGGTRPALPVSDDVLSDTTEQE